MSTTEPVLEVRDFLGIKDAKIPIKPITLVIGPQASGKSVIAKLLYYFSEFSAHLFSTVQKRGKKKELNTLCKETFISYFAPASWADDKFNLRLSIGNEYIQITREVKRSSLGLSVSYSPWFATEMQKVCRFIKSKSKQEVDEEYGWEAEMEGRALLRKHFADHFDRSWPLVQIFVPAGRSFFANLQNNVFGFLSSSNAIDPFLSIFGKYFEAMKRNERLPFKETSFSKQFDAKIKGIICGEYFHEKGKDFIKIRDGRKINLANASSGQQEAIPLAITLRNFIRRPGQPTIRALYIEEPEAHLFPASQKSIVELLSLIFNYNQGSMRFFVTTHSPYVLTAFNNLLFAGLIQEKASKPVSLEVNKIVSEQMSIKPQALGAYLVTDGVVTSIIDDETGLIDAQVIDSVSTDIASQFEKLSQLNET